MPVSLKPLCKQFNNFDYLLSGYLSTTVSNSSYVANQKLRVCLPIVTSLRSSHTFLSRITAEQLWKGVTSVSPAGRRKGRGRASGRTKQKDLNRGQVLGFGKKNMIWPGLNAPVVQGREIIRQQELPRDEEREKRILELRDKSFGRKFLKLSPLERGWTGNKLPGRSLGAPDPVGEETFEGFDSRVLEFKPVMHMSGTRGRVRRLSALVIVGNKNGLAGFAKSISVNGNSAAKSAKNRAAKVLRYVERDNNSVVHDFYSEFGAVKIFVQKQPEGYGLVCHRVLRAICEMIGIKDLYAKVEGPTKNYQCITKAFFIGLHRQKSLEEIANEKGLHLVEMKKSRDYFPVVVASPEKCRTEEEIGPTEQLDYRLHLLNGRVEAPRKKYEPFYFKFPSYIKEMKDRERQRNQRGVRIHLLGKYGALKSFINVREEEKAKQELKQTVEE
ncbi:28S ribosomal protein S5, mitochondrial [Trichonephila inaurata madagascariensis]|uniref:Small ribosomal subunit protein uS5m n=1 Tax=Trichonephila inaurata madagascariensis TaxID=2747483 RepID=A0A8X6YS64_9ARAC|nr:28S ribosomal protein S5, mitochondrial [Trichonephila inaurata madagascariensis]